MAQLVNEYFSLEKLSDQFPRFEPEMGFFAFEEMMYPDEMDIQRRIGKAFTAFGICNGSIAFTIYALDRKSVV